MIKTNTAKCIKCHKCIKVCPFTVLETDPSGFPVAIEGKICMSCMHCAAACPEDALTYNGKEAITDEPLKILPAEFSENLEAHIKQVRSYRHFSERPVDKAIIENVLDTARWAPSAKNQHPTKYMVITSPKIIHDMMDVILSYVKETGISPEIVSEYEHGNNVVMGKNSKLILAYARDNAVNAPGDTYIAMSNIELLLQSKGIGTCWCGYLTRLLNSIPELRDLLPGLPENNSFQASFMFGYPEGEEYLHIPERLKESDIKWVE